MPGEAGAVAALPPPWLSAAAGLSAAPCSAATASSSSATNCCTVAEAVFLMVEARLCWSVRQSSRSCETVVSEWSSAGEEAMVSTVCSTLSSDDSSADGCCTLAISCEVTVCSRCGAMAECEIMRCTAPSAESGSASDLDASASMNGTSITELSSSACCTAAACCASVASAGSALTTERSLSRARSAASFTSGYRRASFTSDSARRSASIVRSKEWPLTDISLLGGVGCVLLCGQLEFYTGILPVGRHLGSYR